MTTSYDSAKEFLGPENDGPGGERKSGKSPNISAVLAWAILFVACPLSFGLGLRTVTNTESSLLAVWTGAAAIIMVSGSLFSSVAISASGDPDNTDNLPRTDGTGG